MPDHPLRGSDLRTPAPTLEPDPVFLARLSALAAAGASEPAAAPTPIATWRVGLAAASVAAVLVGVAWLAGLQPGQSPQPAPPPATSPSAPQPTPSVAPTPSPTEPALATAPDAAAGTPGAVQTSEQPHRTGDAGRSDDHAEDDDPSPGRSDDHQNDQSHQHGQDGQEHGTEHGKGQGKGNGKGQRPDRPPGHAFGQQHGDSSGHPGKRHQR